MPSAPPEPAPPMSMAPNKRDASAAAGRRSHQTPTGVRQGGRCRRGASVRAWDWQREARARSAAVRRAFPPPPPCFSPALVAGGRGGVRRRAGTRSTDPSASAVWRDRLRARTPTPARARSRRTGSLLQFWRPLRTLPQFDSHLEPWVVRSERCIRPRKFASAPTLSCAGAGVCADTCARCATRLRKPLERRVRAGL